MSNLYLIRSYILVELKSEPLFFTQLAAKLTDYNERTIQDNLYSLKKGKLIEETNGGIYTITDYGRAIISNHIQRLIEKVKTNHNISWTQSN